jgi:hypothetical protein
MLDKQAPLETYIMECPQCKKITFNGWDCNDPECRHAIPDEARQMYGRVATNEEVAKALGITMEDLQSQLDRVAPPIEN